MSAPVDHAQHAGAATGAGWREQRPACACVPRRELLTAKHVSLQAVDRASSYAHLPEPAELRAALLASSACKLEEKLRQVNELM